MDLFAMPKPAAFPEGLHVGTSSWTAEGWLGTFYPPGTKPRDFLPYYATRYDTVEVDSTYYRLPSPALTRKWRRDTADGFDFALKVTKTVTHEKVLEGAEKEFETFLSALEPLAGKVSFVLFQFGYFNRKSACPDLGTFLRKLGAFSRLCDPRFAYAVEIRNPRWIGRDLLGFLREHRFTFVMTDQEWMPRPAALWDGFGAELITAGAGYARFLGERRRIEEITTTWDRLVIDRRPQMAEWLPIFKALLRDGVPLWAYFNNHYAGHAPGSTELLRSMLSA